MDKTGYHHPPTDWEDEETRRFPKKKHSHNPYDDEETRCFSSRPPQKSHQCASSQGDLHRLSARLDEVSRHAGCLEEGLVRLQDQLQLDSSHRIECLQEELQTLKGALQQLHDQLPQHPVQAPPPPPPTPPVDQFVEHYAQHGLQVHLKTGMEEMVSAVQTLLQHSHDTTHRQLALEEGQLNLSLQLANIIERLQDQQLQPQPQQILLQQPLPPRLQLCSAYSMGGVLLPPISTADSSVGPDLPH